MLLTLLALFLSDYCESNLDVAFLNALIIYLYSFFDFLESKYRSNFYSDVVDIKDDDFNLIQFIERIYLKFKSNPFLALNWLICNTKLFIHWLFSKRLFYTFNFLKNLNKFHFTPVLWRPLIKKYSYYGYYTFNRTKWLISFFKTK